MELIPLAAKNRDAWDRFCRESPDAWFWHTTDWLDYSLAYRPELQPRSFSFLCVEGPRILAAIPLQLTHHEENSRKWKAFSLGGGFLPSPALVGGLSPTERDDTLDFIFGAIDDLAEELDVSHSRFRTEVLRPAVREPRHAPYNFLLRHDYIDCSINTQLIDLRLSRNDLRAGLRRNHQRSIEKARKLFKIKIRSGPELTNVIFDQYVEMHARAAKRRTRPRATFEMMRAWIQSGRGFFVEALANDGKTAGFELYIVYKDASYGLSACNEPDYKHLPIRHLIEWEAMMWMRDHGVQFYDIGAQHFGILPYAFPERKNLDISHFKYGFGGATVPFFHAERFHSSEHWQMERRLRDELFAQRYPWKPKSRSAHGRALLALLDRDDEPPAKPANRPEESTPVPEALLALAGTILRDNPEAARQSALGNARTLHFLVGQALRGSGSGQSPLLVRRAIEQRLAQIVAGNPQT